jgi:hypothetical protein
MNRFPEFEAMFRAVKLSMIMLSGEECTFFSVALYYVCIYCTRTVRGYLAQYENRWVPVYQFAGI